MKKSLLFGLACIAAACGKDDKKAGTGDNTSTPPASAASSVSSAETTKTLPEPPSDVYEGKARLINLATKDGKPVTVDVWATRSFKYAPVKLAENVKFGESTDWFQSPKGSPVKAFVAGTGPDSKEDLGGMFHPQKDEHITAIIFTKKDGKPTNGNYWETSPDASKSNTPDAPPNGKAFVIFRAGQLKPYEDQMKEVTGGWALRLGDGTGKCMKQRVEDQGYSPSLLGGTQPIKVDVDPGKHTFTFHKGMEKECNEASQVYSMELDVKADTATMVVLYTPDAKQLKHSVFPSPVNTAKPYGTNKKLKEERDAARAKRKAEREAKKAEETQKGK